MRIFLDANVLVSVLNREYPYYDACARCLSLAGSSSIEIVVSSLSLGIAFYFAEKRSGRKSARLKIAQLLEKVAVSPCGEAESRQAVSEKQSEDFEDALQYFSALSAGSSIILTNNPSDYHFANILVKRPEDFLKSLQRK
jgi:predicted nucleic acid-binding protein